MSSSRAGSGDAAVVEPPSAVMSRLADVPLFAGGRLDVVPLTGGMTNLSYRVTVGGRAYVARLSSPFTELLGIDREAEYRNSVAAAASGAAPPVAAYSPAAGVLVVGWVDGRTLAPADLADLVTMRRTVATMRVLHAGPRFVGDFDMFEVQRHYLDVVRRRGFRMPPGYLDHMPAVERIRAALAVHPQPRVPCHNDLVPANLIDDGDRIRLIDYEYSGNNEPCFELGNMWSESGLAPEMLDELVGAYFDRPARHLTARARLLGLVARYGWTLWASIQDGVSPLDFDFRSWGAEQYDQAVAEFEGPHLSRLFEEVCLDH